MIQFNQVSFSRHTKKILEHVDLTIHAKQKVGLLGKNGSGKTSLMMLLRGELSTDAGTIHINKGLTLNYLQQEIPQTTLSALDYALAGDQKYTQLQQALIKAEQEHDGIHIAEIHTELNDIDGYALPAKAGKILHGLGFTTEQQHWPLNSFSGGWQMRLNLAQLLMSRADILLLDEPTNHLDLEAIVWLEEWLRDCPQTIILVSHDRDFLDHVVTHIVHLENCTMKTYAGNYSAFEKQLAEQLALQQATYEKQQVARAHLQKFVDRFRYKASKARQAQSRLKMLERMELVAEVQERNPFRFQFKPCSKAGNPMLTLENLALGYGDKTILKKINCSLRDGDRIGLIGPNGAGKSTFIKFLANELPLQAGVRHGSNKIKVGYFAQHQLDLLNLNESPIEHLLDLERGITEARARQYLGSFAFSNEDVFRPVQSFSGGEKARLVLALIIWQAPNLLLLDEPTNHLDLEMREALNLALQEYEGALVLVSHDRHLLNSVTNELWLVANHQVQLFDGDLEDYQRWFMEQEKISAETPKKSAVEKNKITKINPIQQAKLEQQLKNHEQELTTINEKLSMPEIYAAENKEQLLQCTQRQQWLRQEIEKIEAKLLDMYS